MSAPVDVLALLNLRVHHALRDCRNHRAYLRMRKERPFEFAASQGYSYSPRVALGACQNDLLALRRQIQGLRAALARLKGGAR